MNLDDYKTDCIYFGIRQTKISEELHVSGEQSDKVIELPFCAKDALCNIGCIPDCPFYEKKKD